VRLNYWSAGAAAKCPSKPLELPLTDAQLLEHAQQGDSSAWRSLYERLLPSVWREVCARLSDRDVAEDIVSETFLTLVRSLHSLEPESCRLHGWILTVARNKVTDWARRHRRRLQALEDLSNIACDCEADPALDALTDERRGIVISVLAGLRHEYRTALELKYAEGLSVREIANRLGQPEGSTQSLLYRARVEFRQKYDLRTRDRIAPVLIKLPPSED
jgi:RNA polymerase sigma-70 factor, ECF subfamily